MSIIFRNTTEEYIGKGAPLTSEEADNNFWELLTRVINLEYGTTIAGVGIDEIAIDANGLMTITLQDNRTLGPYQFPIAKFNPRGIWQPATLFAVNDVFTAQGGFYVVLFAHTSDSTFDPGANNGAGRDYYGLLFNQAPWTPKGAWQADYAYSYGDIVTVFGALYLVLAAHQSAAEFDPLEHDAGDNPYYQLLLTAPSWLARGTWLPNTLYNPQDTVAAFGKVYQVMVKHTSASSFSSTAQDSNGNYLYVLLFAAPAIPSYDKTGSTFTPSLADANSVMRMTDVNGCAITMPPHSEVPFELFTELHYRQCDFGPLTFLFSSPVILNPIEGRLYETNRRGAMVGFKQYAIDEWDMIGHFAATGGSGGS